MTNLLLLHGSYGQRKSGKVGESQGM